MDAKNTTEMRRKKGKKYFKRAESHQKTFRILKLIWGCKVGLEVSAQGSPGRLQLPRSLWWSKSCGVPLEVEMDLHFKSCTSNLPLYPAQKSPFHVCLGYFQNGIKILFFFTVIQPQGPQTPHRPRKVLLPQTLLTMHCVTSSKTSSQAPA